MLNLFRTFSAKRKEANLHDLIGCCRSTQAVLEVKALTTLVIELGSDCMYPRIVVGRDFNRNTWILPIL